MRLRTVLSYGLLIAGAVYTFAGARTLLEWRLHEMGAAAQFERPAAPQSAALSRKRRAHAGDTIGRLTIPRLHVQLYIVEGDGAAELRRGPGHMAGTAMPGAAGNCVIAGHRDTYFRALKDIREGDDMTIETDTGAYHYRVRRILVAPPGNTSALQPTADAMVHLITCYPFSYVGPAPKRFVVQAELAAT